jgi:hypothetical protein
MSWLGQPEIDSTGLQYRRWSRTASTTPRAPQTTAAMCSCSGTSRSAKRVFGEAFGVDHVEVRGFGNLFVAAAFLHGLAQEDIAAGDLVRHDPEFEIVVTVCARK